MAGPMSEPKACRICGVPLEILWDHPGLAARCVWSRKSARGEDRRLLSGVREGIGPQTARWAFTGEVGEQWLAHDPLGRRANLFDRGGQGHQFDGLDVTLGIRRVDGAGTVSSGDAVAPPVEDVHDGVSVGVTGGR